MTRSEALRELVQHLYDQADDASVAFIRAVCANVMGYINDAEAFARAFDNATARPGAAVDETGGAGD